MAEYGKTPEPIHQTTVPRKPCPSCGENISVRANVCPYCNNAIFSFNQGSNAVQTLIIYIVTFAFLSIGITMCATWEMENIIMPSAERSTERLMQEAERDAEAMIRRLSQ